MGLFTAVRDPGVRRKLAEACQPGSSNPVLLSCAKKNGVGRQEEVAQRKPFKRVSSGLLRKQKGCGPFEIPGVPDLKRLLMGQSSTGFGGTLFLACKHLLVCKMTDDYAAKQQIWGHLSAARIFAEQKCLATDKVSQICCSAGRSSDILQTSKAVHTRKRVLPKYVEDARLGGHCKSGTPGISKGSKPFCIYAQA